jgi:hypothetical protein
MAIDSDAFGGEQIIGRTQGMGTGQGLVARGGSTAESAVKGLTDLAGTAISAYIQKSKDNRVASFANKAIKHSTENAAKGIGYHQTKHEFNSQIDEWIKNGDLSASEAMDVRAKANPFLTKTTQSIDASGNIVTIDENKNIVHAKPPSQEMLNMNRGKFNMAEAIQLAPRTAATLNNTLKNAERTFGKNDSLARSFSQLAETAANLNAHIENSASADNYPAGSSDYLVDQQNRTLSNNRFRADIMVMANRLMDPAMTSLLSNSKSTERSDLPIHVWNTFTTEILEKVSQRPGAIANMGFSGMKELREVLDAHKNRISVYSEDVIKGSPAASIVQRQSLLNSLMELNIDQKQLQAVTRFNQEYPEAARMVALYTKGGLDKYTRAINEFATTVGDLEVARAFQKELFTPSLREGHMLGLKAMSDPAHVNPRSLEVLVDILRSGAFLATGQQGYDAAVTALNTLKSVASKASADQIKRAEKRLEIHKERLFALKKSSNASE